MIKKILILALLFLSFDAVSGQGLLANHKAKSKRSRYTPTIKARKHLVLKAYSTEPPPLLTAYAPQPPQFDFESRIQNNNNSDSSKQVHICGCGSWTAANAPLFFVFSHKKRFKVSSTSNIKPFWIQSISVLKDSTTVSKYGQDAVNGVILLTINDKEYPAVYKQLKRQNKSPINQDGL